MKDNVPATRHVTLPAGIKSFFVYLLALLLLVGQSPAAGVCAATPGGESRIAFAARVDGNWDIYSIRTDGSDLRRITTHPAEDRAPAFSPDGTQLLFQSRRSGYWQIYRLDLKSGELAPLTDHPAYDGMPAWSPDGAQIAFESAREGDLDIYVMSAEGESLRNLTADSPFGEIGPAWSPQGDRIAFSSWRYGDKDIFSVSPLGDDLIQLTISEDGEDQPAWSPQGDVMAYVGRTTESRELYLLSSDMPPAKEGGVTRLTWSTANEWPVWSPDGTQLAWLEQSYHGWKLRVAEIEGMGGLTEVVVGGQALAGALSWSADTLPYGAPLEASTLEPSQGRDYRVRWAELDQALEGPEAGWERVLDLSVPNERFNASIAPRFIALRAAVVDACGRDFLATLSDAWRPLDVASDTSSVSSWHKTGRAIDTLFELRNRQGRDLLEVVREDIGGQTYWRLYLRCAQQDGSQGAPLSELPWDFSTRARLQHPEWGGRWKYAPAGYYLDFTDLAQSYGWSRIPAVDRPEYSWKWHFLAIEYWHFQQDNDIDWYGALRQVYPEEELHPLFNWETLTRNEMIPQWRIALVGVPVPMAEWRWELLRP